MLVSAALPGWDSHQVKSRNLARRSRSLMLPVTVAGVCGGLFSVLYVLTVRTTDGRLVSDAALRGAINVGPGMSDAVDRVSTSSRWRPCSGRGG